MGNGNNTEIEMIQVDIFIIFRKKLKEADWGVETEKKRFF